MPRVASIATLTKGGMGTLRIHEINEHPAAVALLHVPALERRELAAAPFSAGANSRHLIHTSSSRTAGRCSLIGRQLAPPPENGTVTLLLRI